MKTNQVPTHYTPHAKEKSVDKHLENCRLLEEGQKLEKLLLHKLCLSLAKIPGNLKNLMQIFGWIFLLFSLKMEQYCNISLPKFQSMSKAC